MVAAGHGSCWSTAPATSTGAVAAPRRPTCRCSSCRAGPGPGTTGGAVATVAAALPAGLRGRVASIQALDPQAITLLLTDGRVVQWGSADAARRRRGSCRSCCAGRVSQFDVTDPELPFTR